MSLGTMLLTDIRSLFEELGTDRLASEDIVKYLLPREDRPWSELRYGKGIDKHWVARTLKDYKIKPEPEALRLADGRHVHGYLRKRFEDAFKRYVLPPDQAQACEDATLQEARDSSADRMPDYLRGPRRRLGADAVAGM
jgi:hypothetical protein